jgi:hypothetical protein
MDTVYKCGFCGLTYNNQEVCQDHESNSCNDNPAIKWEPKFTKKIDSKGTEYEVYDTLVCDSIFRK